MRRFVWDVQIWAAKDPITTERLEEGAEGVRAAREKTGFQGKERGSRSQTLRRGHEGNFGLGKSKSSRRPPPPPRASLFPASLFDKFRNNVNGKKTKRVVLERLSCDDTRVKFFPFFSSSVAFCLLSVAV